MYMVYKIFQFKRLFLFMKKKLTSMQKLCPCYNKDDEDKTASQENEDDDILEIPDRMINPGQCEEDNINASIAVRKDTHACASADYTDL